MATTASTRRHFLSLLGLSAVVVSCGTTATGATSGKGQTRTLRYQGWAGQVTLPELAEDLGYLEDVKLKWVGNTISGPQDIQSAATGQTDFGGAFNGAVVKLAASNTPIKAVISYYGSDKYAYNGFYILKDSPIRSARDLLGKKVGMNTLGAHSEAMLDIRCDRGSAAAVGDRTATGPGRPDLPATVQ
jgi:ABC-type nitrate/sulfonate/bicarbonate transport system substrate-binding protein